MFTKWYTVVHSMREVISAYVGLRRDKGDEGKVKVQGAPDCEFIRSQMRTHSLRTSSSAAERMAAVADAPLHGLLEKVLGVNRAESD